MITQRHSFRASNSSLSNRWPQNPIRPRQLSLCKHLLLSVLVLGLPGALTAEPADHPNVVAGGSSKKERAQHAETLKSRTNKGAGQSHAARPRVLVYWSKSENRWKPIPLPSDPAMRAAREAAREVAVYMVGEQAQALVPPRQNTPAPKQKAAAPVPAVQPKVITEEPQKPPEKKPVTMATRELPKQAVPSLVEAPSTPSGANAIQRPPATKRKISPKIDAVIQQAAARHGVDPDLVRAVIQVESNFNPRAVSKKGAMGLMQLMPETAKRLKVNNPFDPAENVDAGVRQLKSLLTSYNGDVSLSVAAYTAGPGAVARFNGVPNYGETRHYTRQISQIYGDGSPAKVSTGGTGPETPAIAVPTAAMIGITPAKTAKPGENSNSDAVKVSFAAESPSAAQTKASIPGEDSGTPDVRVYRAPNGVLVISDR